MLIVSITSAGNGLINIWFKLSDYSRHSSSESQNPTSSIINELRNQFKSMGINEETDYRINKDFINIFHPSIAIRVLAKIISQEIHLPNARFEPDMEALKKLNLQLTMNMTEDKCYVSDVDIVNHMHQEFFNELARKIKLLHDTNSTMHNTRVRLDRIIATLAKHDHGAHFHRSAFTLLLSSLLNSVCTIYIEDKSKSIGQRLTSIFAKADTKTKLINPYRELIDQYQAFIPLVYHSVDREYATTQLKPDMSKLLKLYNDNVTLLDPLENAQSTPEAARSSATSSPASPT